MSIVELEKVVPDNTQMDALYDLLKAREHFISHRSIPAYEKHCDFVKNHPYREWYLVCVGKAYAGSIYIGFDNSIGINNLETLADELFESLIHRVREVMSPLPPVPSVRPAAFFVNVAPSNTGLMQKLQKLGYAPVQITYSLDHKIIASR